MSLAVAIVECAIEWERKLLFITRPQEKHAGGLLAFPGGKVELPTDNRGLGHDLLKTAILREVHEEVGLTLLDPLEYVTSQCFTDSVTEQTIIDVIFYCRLSKTKPTIVPSAREVPEFCWLSKEALMEAPNAADWLKAYVNLIPAHRS